MTDTPLSDDVVGLVARAIEQPFLPHGYELKPHLLKAAACAALEAARYGETVEALTDARAAIASLDAEALGMVTVPPEADGETGYQYPVRDELLSKIDRALLSSIGASHP